MDMAAKICTRPFTWLETFEDKCHMCCVSWSSFEGIKIDGKEVKSIRDMWNHPKVQDFRSSILDGSFRYCDQDVCPFLSPDYSADIDNMDTLLHENPVKNKVDIKDPRMLDIIENNRTQLDDGPFAWVCDHDRTCNLSCPTCRNEVIALKGKEVKECMDFQEKILSELGPELKLLYVTGGGDPFASTVYKKLLRELKEDDYPDLEVHLHTNGQLWTPENWEAMNNIYSRITSAHISVDGASPDVYAINRRGGDFFKLMKNFELISSLRRNGPLRHVIVSFVVQANNYKQMPEFVKMAERFGFDCAYFKKVINWGTFTPEEFKKVAIHNPLHPKHCDFLKVLTDDCFENDRAALGVFNELRLKAVEIKVSAFGFKGFALKLLIYRLLSKYAPAVLSGINRIRKRHQH